MKITSNMSNTMVFPFSSFLISILKTTVCTRNAVRRQSSLARNNRKITYSIKKFQTGLTTVVTTVNALLSDPKVAHKLLTICGQQLFIGSRLWLAVIT